MANSVRYFFKLNLNILNNNMSKQLICNASRTLYTEAALGITGYKNTRTSVSQRINNNVVDSFKKRLRDAANSEKEMIFSEDLKSFIHLVEKNSDDIQLFRDLIIKFNTQDEQLRFSTFKFGPVVMRALHYLNESDLAMELYMHSNCHGLFSHITTHLILMDLLYENGRYSEILEMYDKVRSSFNDGLRHPKLLISLIAMSCYKMNTPESLEYGLRISKQISEIGQKPVRRLISAVGALALKQKKPHHALELVAFFKNGEYITLRCIRVMALAELNRLTDVEQELRKYLINNIDKKNFYRDVITSIQAAIDRADLDEDAEINKLLLLIQSQGNIQNVTMDEHLSMPIDAFKRNEETRRHEAEDNWESSQQTFNRDNRRLSYTNKRYNQA